jgi:hypothetical protein
LVGGPPFHLSDNLALLLLGDARAGSGLALIPSSFPLLIYIVYIIIAEML